MDDCPESTVHTEPARITLAYAPPPKSNRSTSPADSTAATIRRVLDGRSNTELITVYRSLVDARTAPPGPATSWLGETIVHGEDVFRAVCDYRKHPA